MSPLTRIRASAAHFLASSMFENGVCKDILDAKSLCMSSIRARRKHLGPDDSVTQSSMTLIRDICVSGDLDWALWNSMLPRSLQISATGYHLRTISNFPARIAAVTATSLGQLLSYSNDGTQSIIRLFNTETWNLVSEIKLSESVYAATVAKEKFHIIVTRQQNVSNSYYWYEAATSQSPSLPNLK